MTALEFFIDKTTDSGHLWLHDTPNGLLELNAIIIEAKKMDEEQSKEELISFQIYLNEEGHITNHDWDFEKEEIVYLHKKQTEIQ